MENPIAKIFLVFDPIRQRFFRDVACGLGTPWFLGPTILVVIGDVKDFPERNRGISVILKVGIERRDSGHVFPGFRQIGCEAVPGRTNSGHEGGS